MTKRSNDVHFCGLSDLVTGSYGNITTTRHGKTIICGKKNFFYRKVIVWKFSFFASIFWGNHSVEKLTEMFRPHQELDSIS